MWVPLGRAWAFAATLVGYVAIVMWLTWPLGVHLATHIPSISPIARMDTLHGLWVLSWESHALATHPARFFDANIYAPTPDALLYSTMGLATLPYFAPTFLVTGNPVLAANLALLACIALGAWGIHAVVQGWTASWLAGVVAAGVFLLTPWVLWTWTPARPIHAALQYLPWIIAIVARPGWSRGRSIALGVLVALQGMADPIYVAPAVFLPIAIAACMRLVRPASRRAGWGLVRATGIALLLLAPLYASYAVVRAQNPAWATQSAWARSTDSRPPIDLDGFVLAGGVWADLRPTGVPWVVLPLVAVGLLSFLRRAGPERLHTRAAWRHAGLWVAVGMLIATRSVIWPSDPPLVVPSPLYAVVDRLVPQVASTLRGTTRLGIAALVGLALLAGLAFAECARRLPGRAWSCAFALLLAVAMYARWPGRDGPYPLVEAPSPDTPIVEALRRGHGPVLEVPAGLRSLDTTRHAEAMYRSIFHWRPLVNGYGSYWPADFPERMALAAALPDPQAWEALRRATGVEAVLVHPADPHYEQWRALATRDDGPLRLVTRDGDDLLFARAR